MITNVHIYFYRFSSWQWVSRKRIKRSDSSVYIHRHQERDKDRTNPDRQKVCVYRKCSHCCRTHRGGGKPSCNVSICLHTLMIKNLLFMTLKFQKAGKSWFCRGTTETRNSNQRYSNNLFIYRYYACYNFLGCLMMMMMMITGALKKKGKESPTGQKGSVGFSKMTPLDEEAEEETSKSASKKVKVKTGPTVSVKQWRIKRSKVNIVHGLVIKLQQHRRALGLFKIEIRLHYKFYLY